MLRAIRRCRLAPLFAAAALLAAVPLSLGTLLHADSDDVLCRISVVHHDESAHRFTASSRSTPGPEHCAICHWLRSLRTIRYALPFSAPSGLPHLAVVASALEPVSATRGHWPARAPPLL